LGDSVAEVGEGDRGGDGAAGGDDGADLVVGGVDVGKAGAGVRGLVVDDEGVVAVASAPHGAAGEVDRHVAGLDLHGVLARGSEENTSEVVGAGVRELVDAVGQHPHSRESARSALMRHTKWPIYPAWVRSPVGGVPRYRSAHVDDKGQSNFGSQ
jgi:hypothetical protein